MRTPDLRYKPQLPVEGSVIHRYQIRTSECLFVFQGRRMVRVNPTHPVIGLALSWSSLRNDEESFALLSREHVPGAEKGASVHCSVRPVSQAFSLDLSRGKYTFVLWEELSPAGRRHQFTSFQGGYFHGMSILSSSGPKFCSSISVFGRSAAAFLCMLRNFRRGQGSWRLSG
jgi:hypothetical protein